MGVKVPAQVFVTEKGKTVLQGCPRICAAVEEALASQTARFVYVPGELLSAATHILWGLVCGAAPENAGGLLCDAVFQYAPKGVAPVEISIGVPEESSAVKVHERMETSDVVRQVRLAIDQEVEKKTQSCFGITGIWSLGKNALMGRNDNLAEMGFYMTAQRKYERALAMLGLLSDAERTGALLEAVIVCKRETGRPLDPEYRVEDTAEFIDGLKYVLVLWKHLEHTREEDREKLEYTVAFLLGRIPCGPEKPVRGVLNILCCALLKKLRLEPIKQVVLLMDTGEIVEHMVGAAAWTKEEVSSDSSGGKAACLQYVLGLYAEANALCPVQTIKMEICARIVRAGSLLGETRPEAADMLQDASWVRYFADVKAHLAGGPPVFACAPIQVWCTKVHPRKRRQAGKEAKHASGPYTQACVEYATLRIESKERVFVGQTVRIHLCMPQEIEWERIEIETESALCRPSAAHAEEIHKDTHYLEGRFTKTFEVRVPESWTGEATMTFKQVRVVSGGFMFWVVVDYTLSIDCRRYTVPSVRYQAVSARTGLVRVVSQGCIERTKGVFIGSLSKTHGLKKSKLEKFLGEDCAGNVLRVYTPHAYTEDASPRIKVKKRFMHYAVSIKGSVVGMSLKGPWKIQKSPVIKIRSARPVRHTTEQKDDLIPSSVSLVSAETEVECAVYQMLLFEDVKPVLSPINMAIRAVFFRKDATLRALGKFRKTDPLLYFPARAGSDPVLLLKTAHNTYIARLPFEKKISGNTYALWSPWTQLQSIIKASLFPSQILKLENIQTILTKTFQYTKKNTWYSQGLLVTARAKQSGTLISIVNYTSYAHFIVMIGMKITCAAPREQISYLSHSDIRSICPIINQMSPNT